MIRIAISQAASDAIAAICRFAGSATRRSALIRGAPRRKAIPGDMPMNVRRSSIKDQFWEGCLRGKDGKLIFDGGVEHVWLEPDQPLALDLCPRRFRLPLQFLDLPARIGELGLRPGECLLEAGDFAREPPCSGFVRSDARLGGRPRLRLRKADLLPKGRVLLPQGDHLRGFRAWLQRATALERGVRVSASPLRM